jgi:hypothetical protein
MSRGAKDVLATGFFAAAAFDFVALAVTGALTDFRAVVLPTFAAAVFGLAFALAFDFVAAFFTGFTAAALVLEATGFFAAGFLAFDFVGM